MSQFRKFLLEKTGDDYTTILTELDSLNESVPVVRILFEILSHIVSVRKEIESVINMVEDKKLKKYLNGFIVSCVFLSSILKVVTSTKK
jgi:hypothetical protein